MRSGERSLEITGLELIDYLELEEQLPTGAIGKLPEAAPATGTHGEPVLATAIIILTAATVQALTTWLKARHAANQKQASGAATAGRGGTTLTIGPDGTITIHIGPAASAAGRSGDTVLSGIDAVTSTILNAAG